jgi:hypothetical protein
MIEFEAATLQKNVLGTVPASLLDFSPGRTDTAMHAKRCPATTELAKL